MEHIGIVGFGCVGRAVAEGFRQRGFKVEVNDIRELQGETNFHLFHLYANSDLIFVCVPTPNKPDGSIDLSAIYKVVQELDAAHRGHKPPKPNPVIVLKSTVVPGTTRQFEQAFPELRFACNPEFMRAEHALKDFVDPDRIVIGANKPAIMERVKEAYWSWKTTPQFWVTTDEAEFIKYLSNTYLVAKVAFALEAKHICELLGANATTVMEGVSADRRINRSHLDPDKGQIPSDSPCLPKDLLAFKNYLVEMTGYHSDFLDIVGKLGIYWKKNN